MKPLYAIGLLLLALTAPSCGGGNSADQSTGLMLESPPAASTKEYAPAEGGAGSPSADATAESGTDPAPELPAPAMRIYRATLRLQVDEPTEAAAQIRRFTQELGGWLQTEREERESWEHRVYLELRVPPARLDSLIRACLGLARFVAQKDLSTEDVGQTYADLTARLNQKREVVAQYQQLLKRAATVQDILAVQEHLRRLQEEIESAEAQRLYLSRQAAYSTVSVVFYRPVEGQREPMLSFWSRLGTAFGDGWRGLQTFVLGLVSAWGVLLPVGLGVWLFFRWRRRRKQTSS